MKLDLYYSPLSSYSQKVLMALHEKQLEVNLHLVDLSDDASKAAFRKVYPLGKVPFLVVDDGAWTVPESSIIVEFLDARFPDTPRLIPADPDLSRQVRMRDRFFDGYVTEPMGKILFDRFRPADQRDAWGVRQARERLDNVYAILDRALADHDWALRGTFSLADCAAVAPLTYCRMLHPFDQFPTLSAYYQRVAARPSFQHVMAAAAPFLKASRERYLAAA